MSRAAFQLAWVAGVVLVLVAGAGRPLWPQLFEFPADWTLPIAAWTSKGAGLVIRALAGVTPAISAWLDSAVSGVRSLVTAAPWTLVLALTGTFAYWLGRWPLSAISMATLLYMAFLGYWNAGMNTLALVAIAVPLASLLGFLMGLGSYFWPSFERGTTAVLDCMQTVPAFAYLIPLLALFGFGPVVGLIAAVLFAAPPMARNTLLGLRSVPLNIVEAAQMSGCVPLQKLRHVMIPIAIPQITLGLNQTIMAALSMVIIASVVGGFADIGWEVLNSMRKALLGESLLAGGVIVLLAIMADRTSKALVGIAQGQGDLPDWKSYLQFAAATGLAVTLAATYWPALWRLPPLYTIAPGKIVDTALAGLVNAIGPFADEIKNAAMFYVLIPVRSGLEEAISPFSWGMEFTPVLATTYWVCLASFSGVAWLGGQRWAAIAGLSLGLLYFFGFTGLPWPSLFFFVVLAALQRGGVQPALFCAASLCFVLLSGMWGAAMVSLYLTFVSVTISAILGGALGFMAAHSAVFSRILSPIADTLQTMPQFVFLIPALILFQLGDFSAVIAVVLYSVVPMIRYAEHGLRSVPAEIIEATEMSGASRWQVLVHAKLPSAFPQLMLGVNQTVMSALSMMVIATLVGTAGLGQEIYSALSRADVGRGLVAGLCIALIAMVFDTVLRRTAQNPMSSVGG